MSGLRGDTRLSAAGASAGGAGAGPGAGTWRAAGGGGDLRFCASQPPTGCNWMVEAASPQGRCASCRLTRAIPDLSDPDNLRYLVRIEAAKRRLISQLIELGAPICSKIDEDPDSGMMFDFLRPSPNGPQVLTGHANGLITLNVEEADDAVREKVRHALREPYRTLLGHFRHEIGHYYWDRLIWNRKWLEPFRELFGDERASYAEALKRNYEQGPPKDWAQSYISAYATMHPWEDWAETWAHYMHIGDSVNTAMGFGLSADDVEGDVECFGRDAPTRLTTRAPTFSCGW
ncbi:putative zinc-binding metallopeptidase [Phenylobacterium sp. J367]|uniref:zinc-binding metallopeptidase family protein n=1 Tax=Phenylobacterium sp. J367 TaxID=2898435 RepID=UPI00215199CE|nr:putative zinc-binding metallopeptidase [Phenylobacterium sp. J367]